MGVDTMRLFAKINVDPEYKFYTLNLKNKKRKSFDVRDVSLTIRWGQRSIKYSRSNSEAHPLTEALKFEFTPSCQEIDEAADVGIPE